MIWAGAGSIRSLHEKKEHGRFKKWRNFGQGETKKRSRRGWEGKPGALCWFFGRRHNSLEAKIARIGRGLSRWGFCNLHVFHFFYTALFSFLADFLSIICCLGMIARDYMSSYWSWIDCKFQTILFSDVFRFKSDDELESRVTFDAWCLEVISSFFLFV